MTTLTPDAYMALLVKRARRLRRQGRHDRRRAKRDPYTPQHAQSQERTTIRMTLLRRLWAWLTIGEPINPEDTAW